MSNPVAPLTPEQFAAREAKAAKEPYIERVLGAVDKGIAVAADASPDLTISADAGMAAVEDRGFKGWYGRTMSRFLNLFQTNHTAKASVDDYEHAEIAIQVLKKSGLVKTEDAADGE